MFGVFQIKISKSSCSYFVKRPFGNLLLFADGLEEIDSQTHDLFKAFGGVSKIVLESTQSINNQHGSLFRKYGCSALCSMEKEYFDERIKVERLKDFAEPSIEFLFNSKRKYILLKQDQKNILFVGKDFKLTNAIDPKELENLKKKYQPDLIYFTSYADKSVVTFKRESILSTILKKLNLG